jgi:hypothetical protein
MTTYTVYRQNWLESERGWGIRPDGCSLHLSRLDRDVYVRQYWDRMPDQVPDEYSRPDGECCAVEVNEATYTAIAASQHGIRRYR